MTTTLIPIHEPTFPFIVNQGGLFSMDPIFSIEIVYKFTEDMFFLRVQDSNGNRYDLPFSSLCDVQIEILEELVEHCANEKWEPLNFGEKLQFTLYRNPHGIYTAVFWMDDPEKCRIISIPLGDSDRIYWLILAFEELTEQVTAWKADLAAQLRSLF